MQLEQCDDEVAAAENARHCIDLANALTAATRGDRCRTARGLLILAELLIEGSEDARSTLSKEALRLAFRCDADLLRHGAPWH